MFAYFTPTKASGEPFTVQDRCLQALQMVGIAWLLAAIALILFGPTLPVSTEIHQRLGTLELMCALISLAIHSVLLPLRHILKDSNK
jgi:hypothetical protein